MLFLRVGFSGLLFLLTKLNRGVIARGVHSARFFVSGSLVVSAFGQTRPLPGNWLTKRLRNNPCFLRIWVDLKSHHIGKV